MRPDSAARNTGDVRQREFGSLGLASLAVTPQTHWPRIGQRIAAAPSPTRPTAGVVRGDAWIRLLFSVNLAVMSDAKDQIPRLSTSIYHSIIANPKFEHTGERTAQGFTTAPMSFQRSLDGRKDAQSLF